MAPIRARASTDSDAKATAADVFAALQVAARAVNALTVDLATAMAGLCAEDELRPSFQWANPSSPFSWRDAVIEAIVIDALRCSLCNVKEFVLRPLVYATDKLLSCSELRAIFQPSTVKNSFTGPYTIDVGTELGELVVDCAQFLLI